MTVKLYHCKGARSVRPLWTLEEMGIPYELESMKFPPRFLHEGYLGVNPLGTVPCMTDGDVTMTESAGICQYLVDCHGPSQIGLTPKDKDYGLYLNWLHRSDATLTFPQTIVLRYTQLEPEERRLKQAVDDYTQWFFARLQAASNRRQATGNSSVRAASPSPTSASAMRFISPKRSAFAPGFKPNTEAYYKRLSARPAFQRAITL